MRSLPQRIGLYGNFGTGNFGNDTSLESMLLYLKETRPDAEPSCICFNPERVRQNLQICTLPVSLPGNPPLRKLANWIYAVRTMRRFEVLIVPGTGILNDFCTSPFYQPYSLFRWCVAAKLCGVPVAMVSVGAGPIYHPISRWLIKCAASIARYRSYRDKFSKQFMESIGLDTIDDPVYPDIALRLPSPARVRESGGSKHLTVGIGVMPYNGWYAHARTDNIVYEDYLGRVAKLVLWLLDRGYHVRLLKGDESDQKADDDLGKVIKAERPSLQAGLLIAEPAHSGREVMNQMLETDIVISSRFHHLVFASKLGKLPLSIGYSKSHTEFMDELGMGAFCQQSDDINVEPLIGQFTELVSNRDYYEAIVRNAIVLAQKRLAEQDHRFATQFLETGLS